MLLAFIFTGGFVFADDSTAALNELKSPGVIDQELLQNFGETKENDLLHLTRNFDGGRGGWGPGRGGRHGGGWGQPRPWPRPVPPIGPRPWPRPNPYPYPYPNPVPPSRPAVVCYADNGYGQMYSATGWWAESAQQTALNECYRYNSYCIARGCNYY